MAEEFFPEEYIEEIRRDFNTDDAIEIKEPSFFTSLYGDETHSLIVAVDGACRNNGRPNARAALGIYFGEGVRWNRSELLPQGEATSQRAELCAVLKALQLLDAYIANEWLTCREPRKHLDRVVIKSDSAYVVGSMAEYINRWEEQGFRDVRGREVQNRDLFERIQSEISSLYSRKHIEVLLWKVDRERNGDADQLANKALDGVGPDAVTWDYRNGIEAEMERYDAERVWLWHKRLGHLPLETLKHTIHASTGMDITEAQIQLEIDKGASCPQCRDLEG